MENAGSVLDCVCASRWLATEDPVEGRRLKPRWSGLDRMLRHW